MKIYLDSAPIIYFVENVAPFHERVAQRLSRGDELLASDLTRLECLVQSLRQGNNRRIELFEEFLASIEIIELPASTFELATQIRAEYAFKTPDALHLAAAQSAGCDLFYSNDLRLARFASLRVEAV